MEDAEKHVSIAQLAVFSVLAPICLFCLIWHGRKGVAGWFYLLLFCILRITGGAIVLSNPSSETGAIISSVAVSPLILSSMAIGHESGSSIRAKLPVLLKMPMQFVLHFVVSAGLAFSIIGGQHLNTNDPGASDASAMDKLRAGSAVFLISWLILVGLTVLSCRYHREVQGDKVLLIAVVLVLPFLGIRILYSLLCVIVNSGALNIVSGNIVLKIILSIVPEMIIGMILVVAGVTCCHVDRKTEDRGSPTTMYPLVPRSSEQDC